jgi:predicted nucleic acid-binding protein
VKTVFVDTSGFYAALNADDPFHRRARELLLRAEAEQWRLSLTDCVSFEVMNREHVREMVADDEHFAAEGFTLPR